jgi:hypothetical protein
MALHRGVARPAGGAAEPAAQALHVVAAPEASDERGVGHHRVVLA